MTALPENSLSVVVPAYNEERNLEGTIQNIWLAAKALPGPFEVVIVNDRSSDRTGEIADKLAARDPRIRVIHNAVNLGFGGSYKRGLAEARMACVVMIPGDDAYPEPSLVEIFKNVLI